jgi:hypothetical protein
MAFKGMVVKINGFAAGGNAAGGNAAGVEDGVVA